MVKLQKQENIALRCEREKLLQALSSLSMMIKGSIFQRYSTCTRANCVCHKGKPHGPRCYVSVAQKKTQKQYYVPKQQEDAVRDGVEQYHQMLAIVDRLTAINLELMRGGTLDETDR